ncbi:hypothetical protein CROQUDRAFT_91614 [Cronartium quercuum f. sp. fusiforme G11]|uniref:Uncharacterized protein n=1 Tax=Cronartium quercuum f. sp. fusiforme G11 TaxID=708437 RepID=A0A9P6NI08_9BASI|nr:hypothetical protein CROQUDRAFT_91614 [Cronartium quercuum f. sp. fusiforme G11]
MSASLQGWRGIQVQKLTLYTKDTSLAASPEKKLVATFLVGWCHSSAFHQIASKIQLLPPNIAFLMSGGILSSSNFPSGQAPRAFQALMDVNGRPITRYEQVEVELPLASNARLHLSQLVNAAEKSGDYSYGHRLSVALSAYYPGLAGACVLSASLA